MSKQTAVKLEIAAPVQSALKHGGYKLSREALGSRPGGAKANKYWVATKGAERIALSLKNQAGTGSTEQKLPFEVMSLMGFLKEKTCTKALVVLSGAGWTLLDWFVSAGMREFINYPAVLQVLTEEAFLAAAKKGNL